MLTIPGLHKLVPTRAFLSHLRSWCLLWVGHRVDRHSCVLLTCCIEIADVHFRYAINLARDFGPRLMSYAVGYGPEVWSAGGYYFWVSIALHLSAGIFLFLSLMVLDTDGSTVPRLCLWRLVIRLLHLHWSGLAAKRALAWIQTPLPYWKTSNNL